MLALDPKAISTTDSKGMEIGNIAGIQPHVTALPQSWLMTLSIPD